MKIYTKTGDSGKTSLLGGTRVDKNDSRIDAYGNIDEFNSFLGLLKDKITTQEDKLFLIKQQNNLFVVGSFLAADEKISAASLPKIEEKWVEEIEKQIDAICETLPPLKHFILPGGHELISHAHISRTVCRRAERKVVALSNIIKNNELNLIIQYLNRFSDYLFVLSRKLACELNVEEIKWTGNK